MAALAEEESIRERVRWDLPLFAQPNGQWPGAFQILPKAGGRLIPFVFKPEQLRFYEAVAAQRDAGLPMRAIILKARQIGFSTVTQALLIQRVTQTPYHHALVLAQLNSTASKLFEMGQRMWQAIPDEDDLKPKKLGGRKARLLELDNGSVYQSDNAKEFEAGRGLTLQSVHGSEVASFPDAERKLTGLLEAVADEPGTLVVLESTAKGQNYFKDLWDSAESGESGYIPFFSPWFEEASYRLAFANDAEMEVFKEALGQGSIGEDEADLLTLLGEKNFSELEALEKLHWRRRKIRMSFNGDVDRFHQEYPSTPEEAFLTTGRHVFDVGSIRRLKQRVRETPEPVTGSLEILGKAELRASRAMMVEVPRAVEFRQHHVHDDRSPGWRIWEQPVKKTEDTPAGQYIIGVDASGGDDVEGTEAYHAIEVIDHRTRKQVAEYRSRIDADLLALECFKAALHWNRPWVAIEITGSWGLPAAKRLKFDYRYPFVYQRQKLQASRERTEDLLGWQTQYASKQLIIAELREMLRNDDPFVQSRGLADEFATYVRDDRNRAKAEWGKTADRLMAMGIAVVVAREKPLRDRARDKSHTTLRDVTLNRAGWVG